MHKQTTKWTLTTLAFLLVLSIPLTGICDKNSSPDTVMINFDSSTRIPMGLRAETTGAAHFTAEWNVVPCNAAPSPPNVLRITEIKAPSGGQFNICWTDSIEMKDGTIEVMVRADTGRIDQGGGPMWRVTDRKNYYVARLNPMEDNFRLYYVKRGRRVMIAGASVHGIKAGDWFTIKIETRGNRITGWVNGRKLIETTDHTFSNPGGVGLWTKADAASSFDNFTVKID